MSVEEKGDMLLDAYMKHSKIEPFSIVEGEEMKIWEYVRSKLIEKEGLGGYKIATTAFGIITKKMIQVGGETMKLNYPSHKAEIEIIAEILSEDHPTEEYIPHIGIELPVTRFEPKAANTALPQADNASASLLYVGPKLETGDWKFQVFLNGEKILEPSLSYSIDERIKFVESKAGSASGFCALGNLQTAFMVKRGDAVRVTGSAEFELKFL